MHKSCGLLLKYNPLCETDIPEYMGFKVLVRAHRKEDGNVRTMTTSKTYLHSYDHIKGIETQKGK